MLHEEEEEETRIRNSKGGVRVVKKGYQGNDNAKAE